MRNWRIKSGHRGIIELAFCLLILALLMWGIGTVYLQLLHEGRMEKGMWVYSMSRIHKTDDKASKELAALVFNPFWDEGRNLHWASESYRYPELFDAVIFKEKLPLTFRAALPLSHPGEKITLTGKERSVKVLEDIDRFIQFPAISHSYDSKEFTTILPGGDFKDPDHKYCVICLQRAMWYEATVKDYGPIPLELIGTWEVVKTMFGGPLNVSNFAKEIKDQTGKLEREIGKRIDLVQAPGLDMNLAGGLPSDLFEQVVGVNVLDPQKLEDYIYGKIYEYADAKFQSTLDEVRAELPTLE